MELKMVFDNLVDVKTGKPVEVEMEKELCDYEIARLADTGERANLAGQRFRAMFGHE